MSQPNGIRPSINNVAKFGQPFDEEAGQLRFEAGSIRNLVQTVGLPLSGRPELIDIGRHGDVFTGESARLRLEALCGFTEFAEGQQLIRERDIASRFVHALNCKLELQVFFHHYHGKD